METVVYRHMESPLGPILVAAAGTAIKRIAFEQGDPTPDFPPPALPVPRASARTVLPVSRASARTVLLVPRASARNTPGAGARREQHWEALTAGRESAPAGRILLRAVGQLEEYFAGIRRAFDLPLDADGNPFQHRVWGELCRIPYGETISYGQLAERIGRPGAARAVGSANARNPLPIVVPCHRVIGADGRLTGYAGGLHLKVILLELEGRSSASPQTELFAPRASARRALV